MVWAYKNTYKATTGHTPFHLMYRQEGVMPMEHIVPSLQVAIQNRLDDEESLKERLYTLLKLDERRTLAQWSTKVAQKRRKHLKMNFKQGQLILRYNGKNEIKPGKF